MLGLSPRSLTAAVLALTFAASASATSDGNAASRVRIIEQRAWNVSRELRDARSSNDASRVTCVSRRLSEIHAQLRIARRHAQALDSSPNAATRRQHWGSLQVAFERARELSLAARSCPTESQGRSHRIARR
jgi:hypothetical protein